MKQIKKMIESGRFYLYNAKEIRLLSIKEIEGEDVFKILVENKEGNERPLTVEKAKLNEFIKNLLPIAQEKGLDLYQNKQIKQFDDSFKQLSDGLMDDFEKISKDKDYIPQAKQRADTVKTVIDMVKTQLDFVKTLNK